MQDIKAIVLAAGLGTRMRSKVPKVLHKVGSKSLLQKVICSLREAKVGEIVVVVGHQAEEVKRSVSGKNIKFVVQERLLGTGDAVKCAAGTLEDLGGDVIVTCADAPLISSDTYESLISVHLSEKAACTVLTCEMEDPFSYGRVIRKGNGNVSGIIEEKDASDSEKTIREINVGTYCFKGKDLWERVHDIEMNPTKKEFYLTDIVGLMVEADSSIGTVSCDPEESIGINSRKDLADVMGIMNRNKLNELMESGVTIVDPGTTWVGEDAIVGNDTTIYPNSVIEDDVEIGAGCCIGPFARIRPGSRISDNVEIGNFVEINRTQISKNTKVKHHSYLGDAVVGKDVNIGAGTITANYDGTSKNRTIIEDNAFIGVGVTLIAPVKIGNGSKVGAGSVVTKNRDVPDGKTVVGIPARLFKSSEKGD